jgi:predicted TIM-barrel fold metal-dependent hydrolase
MSAMTGHPERAPGPFIDIHGHLAPLGETGGGPPSLRDPGAAIEAKRALGVELTIIGSPVGAGSMLPGSGVDNYAQPVDEVRAHNEAMGELVDHYPDALRAYAYLDPFGGDAMLEQAVDLLGDRRFVGFIVNSSVRGAYLGSPGAADFFAMVAETGAPVLLHPPAEPVGTTGLVDLGIGIVEHVARPCDVTLGVASIVCAGWLERYPGIKLIAAAGGGGLALLAEKLDLAMARRPGRNGTGTGPGTGTGNGTGNGTGTGTGSRLTGRPSDSLRKVLVDTSCPSRAQMLANLRTFGPRNILFGSDGPPLMDGIVDIVDIVGLPYADGRIDEASVAAIARNNAIRLFDLTDVVRGWTDEPWPARPAAVVDR